MLPSYSTQSSTPIRRRKPWLVPTISALSGVAVILIVGIVVFTVRPAFLFGTEPTLTQPYHLGHSSGCGLLSQRSLDELGYSAKRPGKSTRDSDSRSCAMDLAANDAGNSASGAKFQFTASTWRSIGDARKDYVSEVGTFKPYASEKQDTVTHERIGDQATTVMRARSAETMYITLVRFDNLVVWSQLILPRGAQALSPEAFSRGIRSVLNGIEGNIPKG